MTDTEVKERAEAERKQLVSILEESGISDRRMRALDSIITNTAWMKIKLDDARMAIKTAQIAITYDNGGGQKGIRENPLFKGYEALWKSYMQGMEKILSCLPEENIENEVETVEKPKTMLEVMRSKHRKEA